MANLRSIPWQENLHIIKVGKGNIMEEFEQIRDASKTHVFVGFSVVGSFSKEIHSFKAASSFLNITKPIQFGLALSDKNGNLPKFMCQATGKVVQCAWQINFSDFNHINDDNRQQDAHDPHHINKLEESGINFEYNRNHGVPWGEFMHHLELSKLLNNEKLHWIAFEGAAYFGHLIKFINGERCPQTRGGFFSILGDIFPICYDVNQLIRSTNHVPAGIENVAKLLGVKIVGAGPIQAGAHSVLTGGIFHKLKHLATPELRGVLYGV